CRTMAPHFEAAARQLEPAARLLKLDSDAEQAAAGALNVSSIPTLILFRDGQVLARQAGAMSTGQIVDWTRRALA
ncbi:MAG TPA: thioredoxin domain-containing protein, partial [Caulobacter sp.]|nr:thioredoxin domain-containing protein [Caulobacter sp.]